MSSRAARRPDPAPLETNDVPIVLLGTAAWAGGLVVLLLLRAVGVGDVRSWWLVMCVCGIALGLLGLRSCQRRQAAIARDR